MQIAESGAGMTPSSQGVGRRTPPSWEVDYGLPAAAAVLGVTFLPMLATLSGMAVLDSTQYAVGALVMTALIAALCLPRWLTRGSEKAGAPPARVGFGLALLFAAGLVSCVYAHFNLRGSYSIDMWQQFGMAMMLFLIFPVYAYLSSLRSMFRPIITGWDLLAIIAVGTVIAHMLGILSGEAYGSRQFGVLGDAVAWLFSALLVVYFERRNWMLFAVCATLLVLTESRAPALIAAGGIVLASVLQPNTSAQSMLKRCALAAGLVGGVFLIPLLMPALVERFRETDFFYNDRVETIRFALGLVHESPWIGLGYNAQSHYFAEQLGGRTGVFMILNTAVSTPVQILTDFGIVGLACFVLAMLALLRASLNVARTVPVGVIPGVPRQFFQLARGLACWLIPFVLLNHSAAYLLPLSLIAVVFFAAAGVVVAVDVQCRAERQRLRLLARNAAPGI